MSRATRRARARRSPCSGGASVLSGASLNMRARLRPRLVGVITRYEKPRAVHGRGIANAEADAEERFLLLGLTARRRLVAVAHAEHGADIRIISAPLADRHERRDYEEGQP